MNENSELKKTLQKFALNQCNEKEIGEVIAYFKKNQITDDFLTVEEIQFLINCLPMLNDLKADSIFEKILSSSKKM